MSSSIGFRGPLRRLAGVRLEQSSQELFDLHFVGTDDAGGRQSRRLFPTATHVVRNPAVDALVRPVLVEEGPLLIQSAL